MKNEKNEQAFVPESSGAQPLEDAQVEGAAGGQMEDFRYCSCCPRGVTQATFSRKKPNPHCYNPPDHYCSYFTAKDEPPYGWICEKFGFFEGI